MSIRRLTPEDKDLFVSIIQHPSVLPYIVDDYSSIQLYNMDAVLRIDTVYCLIYGEGVLFILTPQNSITYDVHTCVLPQFRGEEAVSAAREGAEWMFKETNCQKITASFPVINSGAYALARSIGMKKEGVNKKSFLRDGHLHDQIIMGLCKEDYLCQQQW